MLEGPLLVYVRQTEQWFFNHITLVAGGIVLKSFMICVSSSDAFIEPKSLHLGRELKKHLFACYKVWTENGRRIVDEHFRS